MHEILFWAKWNIFISVSGQFLITVYMLLFTNSLRVLFHCSLDSTELSYRVMKCHVNTWKSFNRNHLHMRLYHQERMIGFYWMSRFSRTTPRTKFHFISPTMKSNVNRISFMAGRNFSSGMFHFGSHVNTKSAEWFKSHNHFLLC